MQEREAYSGVQNLEVMQEAENYNRYLLDTVLKHATAPSKVLDFGAGGGEFAIPISALGINLIALEPDESLRQRLHAKGIDAFAETQALPDESFEYAYTLNVLEHIKDDVHALEQLHAKLVPGGRLLIYVPAFPVLFTSMDAKVGHIRRYTRSDLMKRVAQVGFSIEYVAYVDSIGFFATLLFKFIGNKEGSVSRTALKTYDRFVFPISKALDNFTRRWFGKNLLLLARKKPLNPNLLK